MTPDPTIKEYFPKPEIKRNTRIAGKIVAYDRLDNELARMKYKGIADRERTKEILFYQYGESIRCFHIIPDHD